jgi:hypothetical protein
MWQLIWIAFLFSASFSETNATLSFVDYAISILKPDPVAYNLAGPASHPIRSNYNWTWEQNRNLVERNGHMWCSIVRDDYACMGTRYENMLKKTKPFDQKHFGMDKLPDNTSILAIGNSYLNQLVTYWACASGASVQIMNLKSKGGVSNNMVVTLGRRSIVLLDNSPIAEDNKKLSVFLSEMSACPTIIYHGGVNSFKHYSKSIRKWGPALSERLDMFTASCPSSTVISQSQKSFGIGVVGSGCIAENKGCANGSGHQCIPGPVARAAELFALNLIYHSYSHGNGLMTIEAMQALFPLTD